MQSEEEVLTRIAVKQNRESLRLREPGDIFTQHTSLGTSQDKKKESAVFTSIYIQFQSMTEAAQPELKAFLTESVALLLQLLQVTLV